MTQTFFSTKVWEADWKIILKNIEKMVYRNGYNFSKVIVFINNVKNEEKVKKGFEKKEVVDEAIVVDKIANTILKHFGLKKEDFKKGYYYSICELAEIYYLECDYILHYAGDVILEKEFDWVTQGLGLLKENKQIIVCNPCWNNKYDEAKDESIKENDSFYIGQGFSDQCYLIPRNHFNRKIYEEINIDSERYPPYGGELFEKRIDAYMRNHNFFRATHKKISYIHPFFIKN